MQNNLEAGRTGEATKNAVDIAIGAIGVLGGPIGAGIATAYYVGDLFGAWDWIKD